MADVAPVDGAAIVLAAPQKEAVPLTALDCLEGFLCSSPKKSVHVHSTAHVVCMLIFCPNSNPSPLERTSFDPYAKVACTALRSLGPFVDFAAAFAAGTLPPAEDGGSDDDKEHGDDDAEGES
jgi:hypothetical protein